MVASIISRTSDWDETATYITRNGEVAPYIGGGAQAGLAPGPCYHLVLSWENKVADDHALETATRAIGLLGLTDHRWIAAIHRDTDHHHIHILADRADPATGKTWNLYFDAARVYKFVREYNGGPLHPTDVIHGRERQFEFWSGQSSFARYAHTVVREALDADGATWDSFHRQLARSGIIAHHTSLGVSFADKSDARSFFIRGSRIGASVKAIEARLGQWEPAPHDLVVADDGYGHRLATGTLLAPWVTEDPATKALYEAFVQARGDRLLRLTDEAERISRRCETDISAWDADVRDAAELLSCARLAPSIRAGIKDAMVISFREQRRQRRHERAGELKAKSRHLRHFQAWLREQSASGDLSAREALARAKALSQTEVRDLSGNRKGVLMEFSPAMQAVINAPIASATPERENECAKAFPKAKRAINHAGAQHAAVLDAAMAASQTLGHCQNTFERNLRLARVVMAEGNLDQELIAEIDGVLGTDSPARTRVAASITSGRRSPRRDSTEQQPRSSDSRTGIKTPQASRDEATIASGVQPGTSPWFYVVDISNDALAAITKQYLTQATSDRRISKAIAELDQRQSRRRDAFVAEAHDAGDLLIDQASSRYLDRIEKAQLNRFILANAKQLSDAAPPQGLSLDDVRDAQRRLEHRFDPSPEDALRELPRHLVRHGESYHWKQRQAGFTKAAEEIQIHDPSERESAICALLLAYEEFGKTEGMTLNGDASFKRAMVEAAVALGIEDTILNKECLRDIERERQRHERSRTVLDAKPLPYGPTNLEQALLAVLNEPTAEIVFPTPHMSKISGRVDAVIEPISDAAYVVLDRGTTQTIVKIDPQHANEIRGRNHLSLEPSGDYFVIRDRQRAPEREGGMELA